MVNLENDTYLFNIITIDNRYAIETSVWRWNLFMHNSWFNLKWICNWCAYAIGILHNSLYWILVLCLHVTNQMNDFRLFRTSDPLRITKALKNFREEKISVKTLHIHESTKVRHEDHRCYWNFERRRFQLSTETIYQDFFKHVLHLCLHNFSKK